MGKDGCGGENTPRASYTKKCEKHNHYYSSDFTCYACDKERELLNLYKDAGKHLKDQLGDLIPEALSQQFVPVDGASARFNQGKIQTREVDPNFILGIGEVLTKSRAKYDHYNWCKPTKLSTPYESMMRHILAFQSGEDTDKETQSHHLLHAATNLMFMYYHITNNPEESDDRFFKKDKKK